MRRKHGPIVEAAIFDEIDDFSGPKPDDLL
jgi:hypothetical protein